MNRQVFQYGFIHMLEAMDKGSFTSRKSMESGSAAGISQVLRVRPGFIVGFTL